MVIEDSNTKEVDWTTVKKKVNTIPKKVNGKMALTKLYDSRSQSVIDAETKKYAEEWGRFDKGINESSSDGKALNAQHQLKKMMWAEQEKINIKKKDVTKDMDMDYVNVTPSVRKRTNIQLKESNITGQREKEKRLSYAERKKNESNYGSQISKIHTDSCENYAKRDYDKEEINESMLDEPLAYNPYRDTRRTTIVIDRDVALFNNIVNNFRKMQRKANEFKNKREVQYKELLLNKEEEGVLKIVMAKLRLYSNFQIQKFFNEQTNSFSKNINDEDINQFET
jgi:hypothetical protein